MSSWTVPRAAPSIPADRVSFRVNGTEVAYVSNRKLYIHDVEITGDVILGSWHLSTGSGFALKWIGG